MKIYNIKINKFRLPIIILLFILAILLCNFLTRSNTIKMTSENYSEILKKIHDSPYEYENKKIEMIGYVFRANDFNINQIVVARDMLINESESRIIGFLCESPQAQEIQNNEWIHVKRKYTYRKLSRHNANSKNNIFQTMLRSCSNLGLSASYV